MINVKITDRVYLSADDIAELPPVSYYEHGSEWESIEVTYEFTDTGAWEMASARGSLWRLTKKGERVKNSLVRGNFPRIPKKIVDKYRPTARVVVEIEEDK